MEAIEADDVLVGMLRLDGAGHVVSANSAFLAWWGAGAVVGARLDELLAPVEDSLVGVGVGSTMMRHRHVPGRAALVVRGRRSGGEVVTVLDASDRYAAGLELERSRTLADRTRTRLQLVIDASIAFASASTEERLAEILAVTAAQAYRAEESAVLFDGGVDGPRLIAGSNPFAEFVEPERFSQAVRSFRGVLRVSGEEEGQGLSALLGQAMRGTGVHAVVAAPLRHEGESFGLFACFFRHARQFDDEAAPLADALAGQASQALAALRLRRRLEYAAMHDETTGLPNRRLLEEQVGSFTRRHRVAVVFIDLDGFKDVNDQLGHQEGDEVLREVGRRLQASVRDGDVVARWGGDEFVVVCDAATEQTAAEIAERIREALGAPYAQLPDSIALGASVGVSLGTVYDGVLPIDRLIRAADQAMYRAKDAGGNRVAAQGDDALTA